MTPASAWPLLQTLIKSLMVKVKFVLGSWRCCGLTILTSKDSNKIWSFPYYENHVFSAFLIFAPFIKTNHSNCQYIQFEICYESACLNWYKHTPCTPFLIFSWFASDFLQTYLRFSATDFNWNFKCWKALENDGIKWQVSSNIEMAFWNLNLFCFYHEFHQYRKLILVHGIFHFCTWNLS